ncbi:MAG: hypothetical protein V5A45_11060 [Haloarculaceae archaeon]
MSPKPKKGRGCCWNLSLDDDSFVAQTGAIAETKDCCAGNPPYAADAIDVPTLVVRGSEDHISQREDALTLSTPPPHSGTRSETMVLAPLSLCD